MFQLSKNPEGTGKGTAEKVGGIFLTPFIQPKLTINQPGDEYEQEADAVADTVMRMPENNAAYVFFKPSITSLQRKCSHCEDEEKKLQRKEIDSPSLAASSTESYLNSISGGSPLSSGEKRFFESRMGYDFSNVRLHTNQSAHQSATDLNALAYTHGNDIVFKAGQYQPESENGKRLIAHELTHVVQQDRAARKDKESNDLQRVPDVQRNGEPQGETNNLRLIARVLPGARPAIRSVLAILRMLGFPISGVAIGARISGTAGDTVQAGVGVDSLYFIDIANLELTTDTLAYGELGVGLTLGAGGGIIIGIRISPNAQYGTMSGAYGGQSFNFSLRLVAGAGFSVSPGIFSGQEGFIAVTISLGAQAGASASLSYAVSGTDAIQSINSGIQQVATSLADGLQTIRDVTSAAGGITQSIVSGLLVRPILTARASLMPSNWNLSALPSRTRAHLNVLGASLNLAGSADASLAYMSRRLNSLPIQPLINEMSADIVQALHARGDVQSNIVAAYMTPTYIGNMSVINFIRSLHDYGLVRFLRAPEAIADEMMQETAATP